MKKRGSKITKEQVQAVFVLIEEGNSLRKACEKIKIDKRTFLDLIEKDEELATQYARSRQKGQDEQFDTMMDYINESKASDANKRLYIDTLKWKLAKQQPKKYGDKIEVEGKNIAPTIIQITRAND